MVLQTLRENDEGSSSYDGKAAVFVRCKIRRDLEFDV